MTGECGADGGGPDVVAGVRRLLDQALEVYRDEPVATARLRDRRQRLDEPLRVAIVGRVKAGKSTLLNAIVGARIAPTDAGECTRVVTLYRHGSTPRVVLHHRHGGEQVLPVRRRDGGLELVLGGSAPEDVASLAVDWPAPGLRAATWIDTPGISSLSSDTSARTHAFLESDEDVPGADAVVFLTRQMQPDDVAFLSGFQARAGDGAVHTTTITVLSRADEVGSGQLDALLAAEGIARRMTQDPAVRAVSQAVLPVAGLLALAGRTLRHADFVALRSLAHGDRSDVEGMLLSADRFSRPDVPVPVSHAVRLSLLERLGLFGVRLSVALIRAGVADAQALADELVRRSGLEELQRLIGVQFTRRGRQLKAAAALRTVEAVMREHPLPEGERLWQEVDRLRLASHELVELELLARLRAPDGPLPVALRAEGERLLGAEGPNAVIRLGLPAGASDDDVSAAALETIRRWRSEGEHPLAGRGTRDAIDVVVQSCEAILAGLEARRSGARVA